MSSAETKPLVGRIYGYGMSSGFTYPSGRFDITSIGDGGDPQSCMKCFTFQEPSMTTVIYGDTRKGYLPAGSYNFTQEGTVVDSQTGFPMDKDSLFARTTGPIYGATMGSCVPRAVQSSQLNLAGTFSPIPGPNSRGCYI